MSGENAVSSLDHHREMVQKILSDQMEMSGEAGLFDYVRNLNTWAAQVCAQLLSVEQRLSDVASMLAAQQSGGARGGDSEGGEGSGA